MEAGRKPQGKRIGNLEFRVASYLLPDDQLPEHPSYHIDYWYPNQYYGRDEEYPIDPKDPDYRIDPKFSEIHFRIHKNCFRHPQSCYAIASFNWDKEGYYECHFIERRPFESLKSDEIDIFFELLKFGDEYLNSENFLNKEEDD